MTPAAGTATFRPPLPAPPRSPMARPGSIASLLTVLAVAALVTGMAGEGVAGGKGKGKGKGKRQGGRRRTAVHVVKSGDVLGDIALEHGCSVRELQRANRLTGDLIRVGQRLKLPKCKGKKHPYAAEGRPRVVRHTVIPGEVLGSIASRYGTTVAAIQRRNRLRGTTIRAGQVLKVRATVAVRQRREFVYEIRPGDTLQRIARRFDITVDAIVFLAQCLAIIVLISAGRHILRRDIARRGTA